MRPFYYALFILALASSCIPNKKVVLLQNDKAQYPNDSLISTSYEDYVLQPGDNLRLEVKSSNPELTAIFNQTSGQQNMGAGGAGDINYMSGYPVDQDGNVEFPLIGIRHIGGKTLQQAELTIESAIREYILDAYVLVRLSGIRFTALGEFTAPGQHIALQSRLNILEAIAAAGDLTLLADRKDVLLIRKYPEGLKTYSIDLTDRALLQSPLFYIQPGDQLYIRPLPVRQLGTGITGVQTLTTVLSVVSTALVLFLTFSR